MTQQLSTDVLICGGGLAGLVTALEVLRAGKQVILVDRDTPERLGGLALWAFGGMALVGTPLQAKKGIHDTPEIALQDWLSFGELNPNDSFSYAWAKHYVNNSKTLVYDWLLAEGLKFLPAVNWVERGRFGEGNSLPRYHVLWGTSRHLVLTLVSKLEEFKQQGKLQILHRHRVTQLLSNNDQITGAVAVSEALSENKNKTEKETAIEITATATVLAMGGINGSQAAVKQNWPNNHSLPASFLNGAHPFADGKLHQLVVNQHQGELVAPGEMWNYAAGFPHPQPHFAGHGLSTIPCKSALWLNHKGERLRPEPLVTGFDTSWLCQQVAKQEKPWTWHLLNWRIAVKEFAISGAEHNASIRQRNFFELLKELLLGNTKLVKQIAHESPHFLVADTLKELATKMNALTGTSDISAAQLQQVADNFDANFAKGQQLTNDDQLRKILHARQWLPDRLRTCKPAPLQKPGAGPFIAIQMQLITRKSLGGLRTNLHSQVLTNNNQALAGLYCVGEAAGFGGGNANGKRSLEGTFLPGCILTARAAARAILNST